MPSKLIPHDVQERAYEVANWLFHKVPTKSLREATRQKLLEFYEQGLNDRKRTRQHADK